MAESVTLGKRLRLLRRGREWTLAEVGTRTGIPISTLSKIEKDQASPNYDQLTRLSRGLGIDVTQLFSGQAAAATRQGGRRSVNRADGEARLLDFPHQRLRYLSTDLLDKAFTPIVADIKARHIEEYGEFHRHPGEEFLYVIEGELELHSESYEPLRLNPGDSIYFDSAMAHAYIARGEVPCKILSICTVPHVEFQGASGPRKRAAKTGTSRVPRKPKGR